MTVNKLMTGVWIASVLTWAVAVETVAMETVAMETVAEAEDAEYRTRNASTCFLWQGNRSLTLTCTSGHMVRLLRVFLGHSAAGTCRYSPGDCTMDVPGTGNYGCVGTSTCLISFPSGNIGKLIPRCRKPSTYIEAQHQCIPVSSSVSVCDRSFGVLLRQRGFLRTPGYPKSYPNGMDCNFTLVAPREDQRYRLFVVDLNLEPRGTGCSDWLQVFDGFQAITLCGQRTRYWLMNSTQRTLQVHFYSDSRNTQKGFWLYYEAFPFISATPLVTESMTLTFTSTISPETKFRSVSTTAPTNLIVADSKFFDPFSRPSSAVSQSPATPSAIASNQIIHLATDVPSQPLGVLLAVVITLLVCILVILLIIVFIKSRSRRCSFTNSSDPQEDNDRVDNLERERRTLYPSLRSSFRSPGAGNGMTEARSTSLLPHSPSPLPASPVERFLSTPGEAVKDDGFCERLTKPVKVT